MRLTLFQRRRLRIADRIAATRGPRPCYSNLAPLQKSLQAAMKQIKFHELARRQGWTKAAHRQVLRLASELEGCRYDIDHALAALGQPAGYPELRSAEVFRDLLALEKESKSSRSTRPGSSLSSRPRRSNWRTSTWGPSRSGSTGRDWVLGPTK